MPTLQTLVDHSIFFSEVQLTYLDVKAQVKCKRYRFSRTRYKKLLPTVLTCGPNNYFLRYPAAKQSYISNTRLMVKSTQKRGINVRSIANPGSKYLQSNQKRAFGYSRPAAYVTALKTASSSASWEDSLMLEPKFAKGFRSLIGYKDPTRIAKILEVTTICLRLKINDYIRNDPISFKSWWRQNSQLWQA